MDAQPAIFQVDVRFTDAIVGLQQWGSDIPPLAVQPGSSSNSNSSSGGDGVQRVELLFLDGIPKDTLSYLQVRSASRHSRCSRCTLSDLAYTNEDQHTVLHSSRHA